jgi:hypothetical protein
VAARKIAGQIKLQKCGGRGSSSSLAGRVSIESLITHFMLLKQVNKTKNINIMILGA